MRSTKPPAPAESKGDPAAEKKLEAYREAVRTLGETSDPKTIAARLETLRRGMPDALPVLVEASRSPSARVRSIALRLICEAAGEKLNPKVIALALRDRAESVRRAAVRESPRLGDRGRDLLIEYFPGEKDARNRLAAIDVLSANWGTMSLVPYLVSALDAEKDASVRKACVKALRRISRTDLGDDVRAWRSYVDRLKIMDRLREDDAKEGSDATQEPDDDASSR